MSIKLMFVRHGETDWNKARKFQGSKDIKLNDTGREQAQKLAERLSTEQIDKIYSSNLDRAYQTGLAIAEKHDLEVEQVPALQEVDFGVWEGLTYSEILEQYDFTIEDWSQDPVNSKVPEGESLGQVKERTLAALNDILKDAEDEQIVIAVHGGVIKVLLATLLEMPLEKCWSIEQDNTAVNIVNFYDDDRLSFELINCSTHLQ